MPSQHGDQTQATNTTKPNQQTTKQNQKLPIQYHFNNKTTTSKVLNWTMRILWMGGCSSQKMSVEHAAWVHIFNWNTQLNQQTQQINKWSPNCLSERNFYFKNQTIVWRNVVSDDCLIESEISFYCACICTPSQLSEKTTSNGKKTNNTKIIKCCWDFNFVQVLQGDRANTESFRVTQKILTQFQKATTHLNDCAELCGEYKMTFLTCLASTEFTWKHAHLQTLVFSQQFTFPRPQPVIFLN